jgi:hypothetical protein
MERIQRGLETGYAEIQKKDEGMWQFKNIGSMMLSK